MNKLCKLKKERLENEKIRDIQKTSAVLLSAVMIFVSTNIALFAADTNTAQVEEELPPYLNEALSAEERAVDLVSRMTQEEKYTQLTARTAAAIPRLGIKTYDWWSCFSS